jgi:hypothetical protein
VTRTEVASIAVRLFAAWLPVNVLIVLPYVVLASREPARLAVAALIVSIVAILSAICWKFSVAISHLLLPKPQDIPVSSSWTSDQVMEVGLFFIGMLQLAYAVTGGASLLAALIAWSRASESGVIPPQFVERIARLVAELAIAAWFILGNSGIRAAVWRLRGRQA